jgi:hypothetical protein
MRKLLLKKYLIFFLSISNLVFADHSKAPDNIILEEGTAVFYRYFKF